MKTQYDMIDYDELSLAERCDAIREARAMGEYDAAAARRTRDRMRTLNPFESNDPRSDAYRAGVKGESR